MKRQALFLVLLLLLLLSSHSVLAQDETGPAPVGLRPDAPTYALHGPYWVGTSTFVIEDSANPIEVRAWYPALNPDGAAEAITYMMHWDKYQFEGLDSSIPTDIAGRALADAEVDASAAPYPLVVFSHGSGTEPVFYAWLVEHLASYGFVVIGIDHEEIVDATGYDFPRTTIVRAQTIPRALDFATTLTAANGALAGMIDMESVAVAGQSYGGYTALAAAGARFDMAAYEQRCAALAPDDPGQAMCFLVPAQAEMAQLLGLDSIPQGLWPAMGDARIDALVTIAGDAYMFDEQGLAEITIPVLALGGTSDAATLYDWGIRPTYDHVSSQQKILAAFEGANHFISGTICTDAPAIVTVYASYYMCSDSVWDINRAHDLMNHFTTAFLLDELKGDAEAAAALAPAAVDFPGVIYEAQGF